MFDVNNHYFSRVDLIQDHINKAIVTKTEGQKVPSEKVQDQDRWTTNRPMAMTKAIKENEVFECLKHYINHTKHLFVKILMTRLTDICKTGGRTKPQKFKIFLV